MKRLLLTIFALVAMTAGVQTMKAQEAYAVYTSDNTTLTFYYDNQRESRTGRTYDLNIMNFPQWYSDGTRVYITKVVFDVSFKNARPTSTYKWFDMMEQLQSIVGIENLNTSEVTTMQRMFLGCKSLASLDVSHFNTAKVTDMSSMFSSCKSLASLDVSHFNTANVTTMSFMFDEASNLTSLDLSGFNTEKVTDMKYIFSLCSRLTSLKLSSFNTAKVTDMSNMFSFCYGLTSIDLSSFNTANVTTMQHMFSYCSNLSTIYVGTGWSTAAVTESSSMFFDSKKLKGGNGTTYDSNHIDKEYARIDKPGQPGYFTASDDPTTYDLWIAGIQVTKQNKDNLTELVAELSEEAMERYFEGDMEITYDNASQTLTLKNAIIYAATGYGIQSKLSSPKIKLIGDNTITADNGMGVRIQPGTEEPDKAVISGGGSLNIKASGVGLRSHLNLFLTDGVKITSEGDAIGFQGWKATSSDDPLPTLTMTGPETMLRTKGTREGSFASYGQLNLQDDIRIMQPSGATFVPNIGIVKDNQLVTDEWVLIAKPARGDVNLDGTVDIADVTAVLTAMANGSHDPQYRVNDDEVVDIADVTAILTIMAGQ